MKGLIVFLLFLPMVSHSKPKWSNSSTNSQEYCAYTKEGDRNGEWSDFLASLDTGERESKTRTSPRGKARQKE